MLHRHPFQKLCILPLAEAKHHSFLAASGHTISRISIINGELLYQRLSQDSGSDDDAHEDESAGDRLAKRRKLDSNGYGPVSRQQSEGSDASLEIVAERKKGERKKTKIIDTKVPNVSHILATSDGEHVITVTAEDKAIRVSTFRPDGSLKLLSQRSLPKKLCAVCLTKDEKTILAADKFGDVYSVPLHQSEGWVCKETKQEELEFKPSATVLTVHTKGNLHALLQQQVLKNPPARKEGPRFEHQLILGHVSLLTDLTVAEGEVDGKMRPFILSSDRDEHIRVSRGIPQAHVIENFCHGHLDFVTKLHIPPSRPELLIAGNGEGSLRLFNWQTGQPEGSILLAPLLSSNKDLSIELPEGRSFERLAISGIWSMDLSDDTNRQSMQESLVLVALEGIPVLLTFVLDQRGLRSSKHIALAGNVLDVAVINPAKEVLVSIDTIHEPFSVKSYRKDSSAVEVPVQCFKLHTDKKQVAVEEKFGWELISLRSDYSNFCQSLPEAPQLATEDDTRPKSYEKIFSVLGEFLYGLENLRKKRDGSAEELLTTEADGTGVVPLEEFEEE